MIHPSWWRPIAVLLILMGLAPAALGGMPSFTLEDVARMRLQTISFFLVVFLSGALAIQLLWNGLRRDFSRLPRLTYPRALTLTGLWGLLFILVLTMISGARELMTPGAWEKSGATYKLKSREEAERMEALRMAAMAELKGALWGYAGRHDGQLPPDDRTAEVPATVWHTPDPSRIRYIYIPGRKIGAGGEIIAYEPNVFPSPLALMNDGTIRKMNSADTAALTRQGGQVGQAGQGGQAR